MCLTPILEREGIETSLVYSNDEGDIVEKVKRLNPDIVAYSLMFGSHRRYIPLSKKIRMEMPEIIQIAGGPYTTFFQESIDELSLDAICIGEGDLTMARAVKKLLGEEVGEVTGFHFKKGGKVEKYPVGNLIEDFTTLPFPDRHILYDRDSLLKHQEFKSFLSGRGCPYLCNYCFNHKFNEMHKGKGKIIRKKTVDYFLDEVEETYKRYGMEYVIFEDDVFTIKKDWFEEFAPKYKKRIGLPYICYIMPNVVRPDAVKLLKESGCHIVRMAIETGNEGLRRNVLNRNVSDVKLIRAADLIHDAGMKLSVSNMIGLPTETIENTLETVELNIRCAPEHPSAQFFMPYPRMELTNIAIRSGYFDESRLSELEKNTWKTSPMNFDEDTKEKMEKIQKVFTMLVRYPSLKRFLPLFYKLPSTLLYYISMIVKILIVVGYLPKTKLNLRQRTRVFFRFFSFYG